MSLQRSTSILVLVVALLCSLLAVQPAHAASTTDAENQFAKLINDERKARGLGALTFEDGLRSPSRDWSKKMAAAGTLSHDPNLTRRVGSDWLRVGENVGVGPSVGSLHKAFMNSSGHRANILGDFNTVGIGVYYEGSKIWVTVTFVKRTTSTITSLSSGLFTDTRGNTHEKTIEILAKNGITKGCSATKFCPDRALTRAEMATFLVRALGLKPTAENFSDVPSGHTHAGSIGALAKAGITKGCTRTKFCPDKPLSRAEMATFLVRALGLKPTAENFSDVPSGHTHAGSIGALAKSGITKGCSSTKFCPDRSLTRAEMASFLVRAFDLSA